MAKGSGSTKASSPRKLGSNDFSKSKLNEEIKRGSYLSAIIGRDTNGVGKSTGEDLDLLREVTKGFGGKISTNGVYSAVTEKRENGIFRMNKNDAAQFELSTGPFSLSWGSRGSYSYIRVNVSHEGSKPKFYVYISDVTKKMANSQYSGYFKQFDHLEGGGANQFVMMNKKQLRTLLSRFKEANEL